MKTYFSIFFLFSIYISLIGFDYYANAETAMKLSNDKYRLVYEYGFPSLSSNNITIEVFNTFQNTDLDAFKISPSVSSFTLTEKPPLSSAPITIEKDLIKIDGDLTQIFKDNRSSREFIVSINEKELPLWWSSGKYSGKIFLSYEDETLVIPIEVVTKTSPFMLLIFSLIGLGAVLIYNLKFDTDNHQHSKIFVIIVIIGMITIPAALFTSTTYFGITFVDSIVAFGVGIFAYAAIHTKLGEVLGLLKPEESILKQIKNY